MKIAQISHVFLPHVGGIEYYVYRLARDAAKNGHDSFVVTSGDAADDKVMNGFKVKYLKKLPALPRNPYIVGIKKNLGDIKPEVVHIHSIWFISSYQAVREKKRLGFKVVNTVHGVYPDQATLAVKIFLWAFKPIAKSILKHSDEIIVLTESEKDKLVTHFHTPTKKIHVIENGIDEIVPSNKANHEINKLVGAPYVLFTGRIIADKNPDLLIKAFNNIARKYSDFKLVFGGPIEDSYKEHLLKMSSNPDRIFFNKCLDPVYEADQMAALYKNAEISVAIGSWEGLPTRVLESMAQGTPSIVYVSGGSKALIDEEKNGFLLQDLDEALLAELLDQFLSLTGKDKSRIISASISSVKNYLWTNKFNKINKIYQSLS